MKLDDCGSPQAKAQSVMTKWRALYDALMPDRKVMLFNSQVGCCQGPSGACSSAYANVFPDWCYKTSTTMYQPADGDDGWDTIIERHHSVAGRSHLARPGSWLDPGYLTLDVGANYYNGSGSDALQLKLDQNRAIFSLWAIVSAPLVAGVSWSGRICPAGSFGQPNYGERCIPSRPVPQPILDILTNREAIRINQEFDEQVWHAGDIVANVPGLGQSTQLWAKPLPQGAVGFVLFRNHCGGCNDPPTPFTFRFALSSLPTFGRGALTCPRKGCRVLEVWANKTRTMAVDANETYTLRRRQALLLRVETRASKTDDAESDVTVDISRPVVAGVAETNTSCTFCWWCDSSRASSCAGCNGPNASCSNLQFPTVMHHAGNGTLLCLGSAGNDTGIGAVKEAGPPNPVALGWDSKEIARPFVSTNGGRQWRPAALPSDITKNFRGLAWQTHILPLRCPHGQTGGCFRAITGDAKVCTTAEPKSLGQTICLAAVDFSLSHATGELVPLGTRQVVVSGVPWTVRAPA